MPKKRGGNLKMNVENVVIAVLLVVLVVLVGYYVHLRMKKTENYQDKVIVVILYHANWCPHCKNMMPEWNSLVANPPQGVQVKTVEESELTEEDRGRVQGFPTIVAEVDGEVKEYSGGRSADEIRQWCSTL